MRVSRLPLAAAAVLALALPLGTAGAAPPTGISNVALGPTMARADIVATTKGAVRLYRAERGRIRSVGATGLVLQWRDGATTTVPLAARVRVVGGAGRRGGPPVLRRGLHVATVREGTLPAVRVHVVPAAAPLPRNVLGPIFGPALSRAGIVHRSSAGVTVQWVDRGRIRAIDATSVTLAERDGTTPQLALSTDVVVTGIPRRGRPGRAQAPALRRGMLVETLREGDGPVVRVHVVSG